MFCFTLQTSAIWCHYPPKHINTCRPRLSHASCCSLRAANGSDTRPLRGTSATTCTSCGAWDEGWELPMSPGEHFRTHNGSYKGVATTSPGPKPNNSEKEPYNKWSAETTFQFSSVRHKQLLGGTDKEDRCRTFLLPILTRQTGHCILMNVYESIYFFSPFPQSICKHLSHPTICFLKKTAHSVTSTFFLRDQNRSIGQIFLVATKWSRPSVLLHAATRDHNQLS